MSDWQDYAAWAHTLCGAGAAFVCAWATLYLGGVSADIVIGRAGWVGLVMLVVALVLAYVADSIRGQGDR